MAVEVIFLARNELLHVWVTTCSQSVVNPSTPLCVSSAQSIGGDGDQGTQEGQDRPQAVKLGHVSRVQLTGSSSPEPFSWVVEIPDVQVTNSRSLGGGQADKRFCRNLDRITASRLAQVRLHQSFRSIGDFGVEISVSIDLGPFLREVRWTRFLGVVRSLCRNSTAVSKICHYC
ncbi:hypothetical protein CLUG_05311 [Clavispora lusitaniae ATCC 42720]|uniref:Uncharacterized protein n=1 Tax=Clavispora lusitaniae (strain ATCC 42720) TaxID=306902 RepID=C4YB19_CLAL4|nr:uncharacterized protein CLUG_05311 [Clavispora lusitaniae ATCC 42720]EEQ41182.1 hypothetical protein CLUG_05311 [Clavispora lusitaniae ATCC 42720]